MKASVIIVELLTEYYLVFCKPFEMNFPSQANHKIFLILIKMTGKLLIKFVFILVVPLAELH